MISAKNRDFFINREVDREIEHILPYQVAIILITNTLLAFAEFTFALPELKYFLVSMRGLTVLTMLVAFPILRSNPKGLKYTIYAIAQIFGIGYFFALHFKNTHNLDVNGYLGEYLLIIQLILILGLCPFVESRLLYSITAFYSLCTLIAVFPVFESHAIFFFMATASFFGAALTRNVYLSLLRFKHGLDYDLRARMLPQNLVALTLDKPRGQLAPAVKMTSTGIICVSCEWQKFSEVVENLPEMKIAEALSSFYDKCVNLMNNLFPEGDCVFDWMGDESYFYIPYNTQNKEEAVNRAQLSLEFSQKLISIRQEIFNTYRYPSGLCIGIAMGRSTFGLSGTSNSRRMIAYGYPVSLAHELCLYLKEYSSNHSSQDIIGFTPELNQVFKDLPKFVSKELASNERLKKMNLNSFFHLA